MIPDIPRLLALLVVMAGVTYLIRMIPLSVFRKKIKNPFIWSFLYYIPYAVLTAMTLPAALEATASPISAAVGLIVAVIGAWCGLNLLPVALLACGGVFICELLLPLL